MKIQTLIIGAVAMFAFAVGGANAASVRSVHHTYPAQHLTGNKGNAGQSSKARAAALARARAVALAKARAAALAKARAAALAAAERVPRPPLYVYVPGPSTPTAYVDPNECQDSGTNCTDVQACEFWGENCGSILATCTGQNVMAPSDGTTDATTTQAATTEASPNAC